MMGSWTGLHTAEPVEIPFERIAIVLLRRFGPVQLVQEEQEFIAGLSPEDFMLTWTVDHMDTATIGVTDRRKKLAREALEAAIKEASSAGYTAAQIHDLVMREEI